MGFIQQGIESIRHARGNMQRAFAGHVFFGPLVFIVCTVPLILPPFGGAYTEAIKLSCLLIGFGVMLLSLRKSVQGHANSGLTWWVVLWVSIVTLSAFLARDSINGFLGAAPRFSSSWIVYVGFAVVMWLIVYTGKTYARTVVSIILLCSFAIGLFGLLQSFGIGYYAGIESFFYTVPVRVPSLLGNPNFSGWWIAATLPLAWFRLQQVRGIRLAVGIVVVFVSIWGMVAMASRGALLGAVVGMCACVLVHLLARQWKQSIVVAASIALAVVVFGNYYQLYRPAGSVTAIVSSDHNVSDRLVAWHMAEQIWRVNPVFGAGPGNFDQYYWELLPTSRMGGDQYFDDPHNVLLALLADIGLAGLVAFAALIVFACVCCVRLLRNKAELSEWAFAACGVAAWLFAALFNPVVIPLWVLLAVLFAVIFVEQAQLGKVHSLNRLHLGVAWAVGIVCCWVALALIVGEYAVVYAASLEGARYHGVVGIVERQRKFTKVAKIIDPFRIETAYGDFAVRVASGEQLEEIRGDVARVFAQHPGSARAALSAAQIVAEAYYQTNAPEDLHAVEEYIAIAHARSTGYPTVDSWAAYFYWRTGNTARAHQFTNYAVARQPLYYYNWVLLAKLYRDQGNKNGMEYALEKAQEIAPEDAELARLRAALRQAKDAFAVDIRPSEPSALTRLH